MTIIEVIRECVVALFQDEVLERTLVLKGGTALHLIEKIDTRLSTDVDFSACEKITSPSEYFKRVEVALSTHFSTIGLVVFDASHAQKPRDRAARHPEFWGGWSFEFKLLPVQKNTGNIESQRRNALMPEGSNSTRIRFDVSEHEYCGSVQRVQIGGSQVVSYTGELLVAEKIRAICQQHPDYPYGRKKDRVRDYYDVYQLVKKYRSPEFYGRLKAEIPKVFEAKHVEFILMARIFEPSFIAYQKSHFSLIEATVKGAPEPFEFYVEQLRLLLSDIGIFETLQMLS